MAGEQGGLAHVCLPLALHGAARTGASAAAWQQLVLSRGGTRQSLASSCGEGLFSQLK